MQIRCELTRIKRSPPFLTRILVRIKSSTPFSPQSSNTYSHHCAALLSYFVSNLPQKCSIVVRFSYSFCTVLLFLSNYHHLLAIVHSKSKKNVHLLNTLVISVSVLFAVQYSV